VRCYLEQRDPDFAEKSAGTVSLLGGIDLVSGKVLPLVSQLHAKT
jgi:hypothetical protein